MTLEKKLEDDFVEKFDLITVGKAKVVVQEEGVPTFSGMDTESSGGGL